MYKVIVIDDSAFMRRLLSDLFNESPDFVTAATAQNGLEAIGKIKALKPDIVTLDIEMPVMNGLDALKIIMRDTPVPVVVVSSLTQEGSDATVRALLFGAVDFITKNVSDLSGMKEAVLSTCRNALKANLRQLDKEKPPPQANKIAIKPGVFSKSYNKIILIGTSTGGPRALQEVIPKFPADLPCGVVVVQHMPPGFTKSLAVRMDSISDIKVKEAENNDIIEKGTVYIAPGDFHIRFAEASGGVAIKLSKDPPIGNLRPAVNPMFESGAQLYGANCVAAILTGMGQDGAAGMAAIKAQKGFTVAEDQKTAIVYGMPRAAAELGVVDKVLPLQEIADALIKAVVDKT
jgi:two-component system chemotaxis response regulator CheB